MTMSISRKSRLLYLAAFDISRPTSGTGTRGLQFLEFFAERYEVHLVYFDGDGTSGGCREITPQLPAGIASVVRVPYSPFGYFVLSRTFYRRARAVLDNGRYDVIFADCGVSGL